MHLSDVDGGNEQRVPAPVGQWTASRSFNPAQGFPVGAVSPDGAAWLGWVGHDLDRKGKPARSTLFTVDLEDGTAAVVTDVDGPAPMTAWSRDGRWIALVDARDINLLDTADPGAAPTLLEGVIPAGHLPYAAG